MDGLRPALFGLFLVSFSNSKPLDHLTLSSQSSESNDSSSSEEISIPNPSVEPLELHTGIPDILEDPQNQTSPQPAQHLSAIPLLDALNSSSSSSSSSSVVSLHPEVTVDPGVQRVVFPDLSTPEPRCYTLPITTAPPKPARGDSI